MASVVYLLCALTSLACAALLTRRYRVARTPLLLWSSFGFIGLAINNSLLFVDYVVAPGIDLAVYRTGIALFSMIVLVYGLIWEVQ